MSFSNEDSTGECDMQLLNENSENRDRISFVNDVPWREIGVEVDNSMSVEEIIKAADLDWKVNTVALTVKGKSGKVIDTGRHAIMRGDTIFDIISGDWRPMQNFDAIEFFKDFVEANSLELNSVGSLRDGKIIWAMADTGKKFSLFNGKDVIRSKILFTSPHSYGQSIDIRFAGYREASKTYFILPLQKKSEELVRINHRTEFDPNFIKETISDSERRLDAYKKYATALSKKKYDESEAAEFIKSLFPPGNEEKNQSRNGNLVLNEILNGAPGSDIGQGTWWALYNAVCFMIDHVIGRSVDTRLDSAWYGYGMRIKIKALEKAFSA